jgi:hypothetical protein
MVTRPDAEILKLPVDERLALVESLWESIRANAEDVPGTRHCPVPATRNGASHRRGPCAHHSLARRTRTEAANGGPTTAYA